MTEPYVCEEHHFVTNDPRKAVKHIQGDVIDVSCDLVKKLLKAQLGIPQEKRGVIY